MDLMGSKTAAAASETSRRLQLLRKVRNDVGRAMKRVARNGHRRQDSCERQQLICKER